MIVNLNDKSSMKAVTTISKKLKVGITSGCFDMFHFYHVIYLEKCRRLCDLLIVGVDSDRLVKNCKGDGRPVINEYQRLAMLNQCKFVDICFIMDSLQDWEKMIKKSLTDRVFKNDGDEFDGEIITAGATLIIIPDIEELTSTTAMINKIQSNGSDT